jgi:hypothetical protein
MMMSIIVIDYDFGDDDPADDYTTAADNYG